MEGAFLNKEQHSIWGHLSLVDMGMRIPNAEASERPVSHGKDKGTANSRWRKFQLLEGKGAPDQASGMASGVGDSATPNSLTSSGTRRQQNCHISVTTWSAVAEPLLSATLLPSYEKGVMMVGCVRVQDLSVEQAVAMILKGKRMMAGGSEW